jgi:hypothetical protein
MHGTTVQPDCTPRGIDMNTLGKILVFLNLLFSVLVTAGIIMVFVTKTNYQEGYNREKADRVRSDANFQSLVDASKKKDDRQKADMDEKDRQLVDRDQKLDLALKAKAKTDADGEAKDKLIAAKDATIQKFQAMNENREAEVKILDTKLAEHIKKVEELLVSNKKLAEEKIRYEIAYESAKQRNENLMTQYQDLLKKFEEYRVGDAAKTQTLVRNPPPEDIKGSIKATDVTSGMVTINLGSDSGLNKGNTLEVYRLKPSPQYVGVVRIMDVRPNEAVGKLILRRGQVQVGDEVASEILSKR